MLIFQNYIKPHSGIGARTDSTPDSIIYDSAYMEDARRNCNEDVIQTNTNGENRMQNMEMVEPVQNIYYGHSDVNDIKANIQPSNLSQTMAEQNGRRKVETVTVIDNLYYE